MAMRGDRVRSAGGSLVAAMLLAACGGADSSAQSGTAADSRSPQAQGAASATPAGDVAFDTVEVARFASPWAMTFLTDGSMLVTEKAGRMLHVAADGSNAQPLQGLPEVKSAGQGGLGEVVVHPDFARNRLVYFSYSAPGEESGIVLARGRLDGDRLEDVQTLFRASPLVSGNGHYAGRIAFGPDGFLYLSTGERQKFDPAQNLRATLGKVLRLTDEGKPAPGNPLAGRGDPAIWSYGHRNPLGLAFDPNGQLWVMEMGPRGGDELNLVRPGRNYGWPVVSNGDHYDGRDIPDHPTRPEYEAPTVSWNPVISPSSLMFYTGDALPAWRGKALIGGLSSKALVVVDTTAGGAREIARFPMKRIRAVDQGPDGFVYLLEDGPEGRLLRLRPKP